MNDETRIPAQRDLPPERLQLRKEHLVREVAMWERAAQQRRRRLALVLVPVALAVLAVTGFTTYALTREPNHLESIGCFETPDLDGSIAVVNADGRNPTALCAELWRQGEMGHGPAPESMAACVLETGAIGVFPSSGKDTCEQLGLADLPPTYAAEAERFAALRDAIAAELGASYGSTEREPKCLQEGEARALVRHEFAARGYEDWGIEVIGSGFSAGSRCAEVGLGFDGGRKVVFLVPESGE
jgi:hypothetical protein